MKPNIVFLDHDGVAPTVNLPPLPFEHHWRSYAHTSETQVIDHLQDADIALTCNVALTAEQLAQLPKLKMISLALTGTDFVDLNYCRQHGITVTNVPAYAQNTVAEHIVAMMFCLMRQIPAYHQRMQQLAAGEIAPKSLYFDYPIRDVRGKILGIIGRGAIASRLAELATALGMQVRFFDRHGQYQGASYFDLQTILSKSDVISLCCPLTAETCRLIGRDELAQMKTDALIINTARGKIVDESALIEAIEQHKIGGAALDVVADEPILHDNPLLQLLDKPNFILTPHVAWSSEDVMQELMNQAVQNIVDFAQGHTPQSVVV